MINKYLNYLQEGKKWDKFKDWAKKYKVPLIVGSTLAASAAAKYALLKPKKGSAQKKPIKLSHNDEPEWKKIQKERKKKITLPPIKKT